MKADLHTHTDFSDGLCSASELMEMAAARGITLLSVTDHDSVEFYRHIHSEKISPPVELITGSEISTGFMGREVHLLAYGIDVSDTALADLLAGIREDRTERAKKIVEKLNSMGIPIDFKKLQGLATGKNIARPHIARELMELGYVTGIKEAFNKYIGDGCPADVKKNLPDIRDAIRIVREAGGIAVLAHPGRNWNYSLMEKLIEWGLEGVEAYHPSHDQAITEFHLKFATEKGIFVTGGSDFHGSKENDYENFGRISVRNTDEIENLKRRCGLYIY